MIPFQGLVRVLSAILSGRPRRYYTEGSAKVILTSRSGRKDVPDYESLKSVFYNIHSILFAALILK